MSFSCPYPNCHKTCKSLSAIKKHCHDRHPPVCLACGERCASFGGLVTHARLKLQRDPLDLDHAFVYYLASNGTQTRRSNGAQEMFDVGIEVAIERLEGVA